MCLHFSMPEEENLEHINAKCHLCTFFSQLVVHCVPIGITPRALLKVHLNAKCQEVTLLVRLLVISVT